MLLSTTYIDAVLDFDLVFMVGLKIEIMLGCSMLMNQNPIKFS